MGKGMERREFLKVIGAAGVGAGLSACNANKPLHLIPYVVPSEDIDPGMSTWYRTTCRECPAGCGMEVRTREGRAVKAEGNPLSPISHGRLCARGQASLQGLYDPDRVPQPMARTGDKWNPITWSVAEQQLTQALNKAQGKTVFLTRTFTGSLDRLIDEFCAATGVERVYYDGFGFEPLRAANRMVFGVDGVPVHDLSNADVVVSFGADFMETWLSPIDYAHGFVQGRAYHGGRRGRLVSVTPHQSLTDLSADEWLPIKPGTEQLVALAMARVIADQQGGAGSAAALVQNVDVNAAAKAAGVSVDRIRALAKDFARNGRSIAVGPGVSAFHANATAVAVAVAVLNEVAGNIGKTVRFDRLETLASQGRYADMEALLERMKAGQVGALLVYGPNPVHGMPDGQAFAAALGKVPYVASFSSYLDDTSAHANVVMPDHHFLESWGDVEPRTGVHSLVQPVMTPVFRTKQTPDVLISVARRAGVTLPSKASTFFDYLQERWQKDIYPATGASSSFRDWWIETLQDGTVVLPAKAAAAPKLDASGASKLSFDAPKLTPASGAGETFTLLVYPSLRFYDGRTANRPWMQELPDPLAKIAWEHWVEINANVADRLGLDLGNAVEITTPSGKTKLPIFPHPGIREDVIAIQLGQGHQEFGRYAKDRGMNALTLLAAKQDPASGALAYLQTEAVVQPTGDWMRVPNTADRQTQEGRAVLQTLSLAEARAADVAAGFTVVGAVKGSGKAAAHAGEAQPDSVSELQATGGFRPVKFGNKPQDYPPPQTYYGEYSPEEPRWALAIDLERCIGCSACMTACYAENNIGIVGPRLIANGRIMSWMRIERYFDLDSKGELKGTGFLPMLCQQCGNAPCEPVCPVYAAYHTPDGLNAQIYNRCVGTRYCMNNCPYKVRYFNWFTWSWPEPLNWQLNPDVVPREKGVMEKCTFCVQRIYHTQREARLQGRTVKDGEITPACAQTCPGEAIVFGNIKDPNSRVARVSASGRGYQVLADLNTQPGITYLKQVVSEPSEA